MFYHGLMKAQNEQLPSKLSEFIHVAMDDKHMDIRGLAELVGVTYEHARRLVRGTEGVNPSPSTLRVLCTALGLNFKAMDKIVKEDAARRKYGTAIMEMSGMNPGLEPLQRVWDKLSESQQRDIIAMATSWAKARV